LLHILTLVESAEVEDVAFADAIAFARRRQHSRVADRLVFFTGCFVDDADAFSWELEGIDHVLFGVLRNGNNQLRAVGGAGNETNVCADASPGAVERQAQGNYIVD